MLDAGYGSGVVSGGPTIGPGGFAVVESDDPRTVARDMALFAPFFEFSVYPVLEIGESSQIAGEAVATRQSIT